MPPTLRSTADGFRPAAVAGAMIVLGVYLLTIAPDLSWANSAIDGVELITASATLGIPHPPGYPTYTVLGKVFSLLPLGTVAFRYNLFSAVTTAAAVGLAILTIGTLHPRVRPIVALSTALLLGFSPLVWSQAVVAEIYGLNLLMLATFLYVWSRRGASWVSAIWLGLAITTHLTSVFFIPGLLWRSGRRLPRALAGVATGLMPLLLLPWLARGDSPIIWGQPANLAGLWWLASGQLYAANFQPGIDAGQLKGLFYALAFGPVTLVMSRKPAEVPVALEAVPNFARPTPVILGITAAIYAGFVIFYKAPDAAVLLIPPLLIIAILLAPRLNRLGNFSVLLPLCLAILTFQSRDVSRQTDVRNMAEIILNTAPPGALLLTPGDRTIFTLYYFQYVEGRRLDLKVIDSNLFAFDWYRQHIKARYPDVFVPVADDLGALQQMNETSRPVCLVSLVRPWERSSTGQPIDHHLVRSIPYLSCREGAS